MFICYKNGSTREAVILSLAGTAMRVAQEGGEDVMQLNLVDGAWLTDDLEPVTFDFNSALLEAARSAGPVDRVAGTLRPSQVPKPLFQPRACFVN
jgi:hypothetical protein